MSSQEQNVRDLKERLETLESNHRRLARGHQRWRLTAFVMVIGLVGLALGGVGFQRNDLLEARGILLRDVDGRLRGSFVVGDDGGVRMTLVDQSNRARAGLWLNPDDQCSLWGFDDDAATMQTRATPRDSRENERPSYPSVQLSGQGKLITTDSEARIIERRHDRWVCAYRLNLHNQTGRDLDQAFYVNLVDMDGYALGRQPRMIRIKNGETLTLLGEVSLAPERADQVDGVMLALYETD